MAAPVQQIRAATRRGDIGWLSANLDAADCRPENVRPLLRSADHRIQHAGWALVAERITCPGIDRSELASFGRLLPTTLVGPPETSLVLATIYQRLWSYVPEGRRPRWRAAPLLARERIAWLRAEVVNRPEALRDEPAGEPLHHALAGITAVEVPALDALVGELVDCGCQVAHAQALRLTREGLHAGLLAPARARAHLGGLLATPGVDLDTLRELAEPWAALTPFPREQLRTLLVASAAAAAPTTEAAIALAVCHRHGDLLREIVADPTMPPGPRRLALESLGHLAERDDLGHLTTLAATDPLLLAGPAVAGLRAAHRRGHCPRGEHAEAIVSLALADHTISPDEVATVLFTCRGEAFRRLVSAPDPDDGTWPRRLALLVALASQGGDDLPVGEVVASALASASRPEPFLSAIAALRYAPAESAVIDALPRAPEAALDALESMGGPLAAATLADGLGLVSQNVIAPHLRPVRHRALALLWHLRADPEHRRAILSRLNPRDLPHEIAIDLGGPDRAELELLRANLEPDDPAAAIITLAENGEASTVAIISDLLSRIVADLAATWEPGAPGRETDGGPPGDQPASEPSVPDEVVAAIDALGRRLRGRGAIRPACLLDAETPEAAGHALVATMALNLLEHEDLPDRERAILLAMLLRAPYRGTRARVHRLLRHGDRHVRKHAIALLTADGTGADAQALSASLIALTAAHDGQTVRQALLALCHARASWAAQAIASCLDHPNMNIKKTSAAALIHTGTPAIVPRLLFWLGSHDNPGLRATLIEALRAVCGPAYAATVLAAAEQAGDQESRDRFLTALSRVVSARSVHALARQGSPAGPPLLALVAAGRVALGAGTVGDLAALLAEHGLTRPTSTASAADNQVDRAIAALTRGGWSEEIALRLVAASRGQPGRLSPDQAARLRPTLAEWLRLARATPRPETRREVALLALRICPEPWSAAEASAVTRAATTLLTCLSEGGETDRREDERALVSALETVAPSLPPAEALDAIARIRATPPTAIGPRAALVLLRRCGAVLTRDDVEWSLASARFSADPWLAETEVLREAFSVAGPPTDQAVAWRRGLGASVGTPGALDDFRSWDDRTPTDPAPDSRDRLTALVDVFPSAGEDVRGVLLDWMEDLQPIGGPPWNLGEEATQPAGPERVPRDGDLDQPRSAVQRRRLLAGLEAPTAAQRNASARALWDWPEPETRQVVLNAFLSGRVEVEPAGPLEAVPAGEGTAPVPERLARLAPRLAPPDLRRLIPLLLEWWEREDPDTHAAAERALRGVPGQADTIAEHLRDRLAAGEWGVLDLLDRWPLLRTPELAEASQRLRLAGRDELADKLTLVDGPLLSPGARQRESALLEALRERPEPESPPARLTPPRQELIALARTGRPEQIRRALTQLAEAAEDRRPSEAGGPTAGADSELENLLAGLLSHPEPRIRLHAHRIGRRVLDRPTYLRHTSVLLDDPDPETVRSAVRTLCRAAHQPAIPALVGLLLHPHPGVRRTAAIGLERMGSSAIPALRHAAGRARPDRRSRYTAILERIADAETIPRR